MTLDFIKYCDDNRILLCILPPHSTHTLQPLDVVCFGPLSSEYKKEVANFTEDSMRLLPIKKGDLFCVFWEVWVTVFTKTTILRSFEATGIAPLNPDKILDRFIHNESDNSHTTRSFISCYSSSDWLKMETLLNLISRDKGSKETKKLWRSIHSPSTRVDYLRHEIEGLKKSLKIKEKHNKRSKVLPLQQRQEYHGGAVFWSPSKRREDEHRYDITQRLDMEERFRKARIKKFKRAQRLVKTKEAEGRRAAREAANIERERMKAEAAKKQLKNSVKKKLTTLLKL